MKRKRILCSVLSLAMAFGTSAGMTACSSGNTAASSASSSSSQAPSSLQASSSGSDVSAKIDLWTHYGSDSKAEVDYAVKKVKEKYPNLEFQIEDMPQDGNQAIKARAATGNLPDIMYLSGGLINIFTKSQSIIELDKYIQETDFKNELNAASQKYCLTSSDGHNYVFTAAGVEPILWYYNKSSFPKTASRCRQTLTSCFPR